MSSQFDLLKARRFAPFFATQFLGAFNDNLFKNALIVLLTFQAASWTALAPEVLTNLAAGIFILPFFLFSATAGQLADKYDKAKLARLVKLLEIVIMGVALLGFSLHSLSVLLTALFLLGLHSTLFGPVKYAILPQHLRERELVGGNALVEAGTFVAILIGTLAGGLLAGAAGHPTWVAYAGLVIAVFGYLFSRGIPAAPAPAPELVVSLNPLSETWRNIGFARQNRTVFLSILGISWFWLYGALFLAQTAMVFSLGGYLTMRLASEAFSPKAQLTVPKIHTVASCCFHLPIVSILQCYTNGFDYRVQLHIPVAHAVDLGLTLRALLALVDGADAGAERVRKMIQPPVGQIAAGVRHIF